MSATQRSAALLAHDAAMSAARQAAAMCGPLAAEAMERALADAEGAALDLEKAADVAAGLAEVTNRSWEGE